MKAEWVAVIKKLDQMRLMAVKMYLPVLEAQTHPCVLRGVRTKLSADALTEPPSSGTWLAEMGALGARFPIFSHLLNHGNLSSWFMAFPWFPTIVLSA
jgi:hypothetical protein